MSYQGLCTKRTMSLPFIINHQKNGGEIMFNFDFYNPTRIFFGKDRFDTIDKSIPADAKVMITFGMESARKNGLIEKVKAHLGNRTVIEYGGITPNPHYKDLMRATEVVRNEKIDFIMAVGGGSVIDGTKFICLASWYEGDAADLLKFGWTLITSDVVKKTVPFGAVLTLPASGSEMNHAAVISYDHGKFGLLSDLIFPQFSILDPVVTFTLPKHQVANGIVDAFVHVMEQYMTFPVNAVLQDRMAECILMTLIEVGPLSVNNPEDYNARANHMWSAAMALNGLIAVGVPQDWSSHFIGHELTALFGIDHGETLAVVFPSLIQIMRDQKRQKLLQYADRVWNIKEGSDEERITSAIDKTREFFESLGIKTHLRQYGVKADKIPEIVEQLKAHGFTAMSETGMITPEISRKILENAF